MSAPKQARVASQHGLDWRLIIGVICLVAVYSAIMTVVFLQAAGVTVKEFDAPAWIQAVGSVAAIFVAIWVMRSQTKHAETVEQERAADHVQSRGQLIRTIVRLGEDAVSTVNDSRNNAGQPNDQGFNHPKLKWLHERLLVAQNCMESFSPAAMSCSVELFHWNEARYDVQRLADNLGALAGGDESRVGKVTEFAMTLGLRPSKFENIASKVRKGDWAGLTRAYYADTGIVPPPDLAL